jgi:hypothetical protein
MTNAISLPTTRRTFVDLMASGLVLASLAGRHAPVERRQIAATLG